MLCVCVFFFLFLSCLIEIRVWHMASARHLKLCKVMNNVNLIYLYLLLRFLHIGLVGENGGANRHQNEHKRNGQNVLRNEKAKKKKKEKERISDKHKVWQNAMTTEPVTRMHIRTQAHAHTCTHPH